MKIKIRKKKGFTLIELIVVIAIIGILSAIFVPTYYDYIEKSKISKHVAEAKNMTLQLNLEMISNDRRNFTPAEIEVFMQLNGYNLKSDVTSYAFWFDSINNEIIYKRIADIINGIDSDYKNNLSLNNFNNRYIGVEAFADNSPGICYIDRRTNEIRLMIDTIRSLIKSSKESIQDGERFIDKMNYLFDESFNKLTNISISGIDKTLLSNKFSLYKPTKTLYIDDDGMYFSDFGKVIYNIVFSQNLSRIPSASNKTLYLHKDVIINVPNSVINIDIGAFSSVVVVENENLDISPDKVTLLISPHTIYSNLSINEKINIATQEIGGINYKKMVLGKDYTISYIQKEARDSTNGTSRVGINDSFIGNEYFNSDEVICEYLIPTIEIPTERLVLEYIDYNIRIENTIDAVRYTSIGIDRNLNGYKYNVGFITNGLVKPIEKLPSEFNPNSPNVNPKDKTYDMMVELPKAIKEFENYKGAIIKVGFTPTYTDYEFTRATEYINELWVEKETVISNDMSYATIKLVDSSEYEIKDVLKDIKIEGNQANGLILNFFEIVDEKNNVLFKRYYN